MPVHFSLWTTKITSLLHLPLTEIEVKDQLLMSTIESRIKEMDKMIGGRQDLIVVASLLGHVPNLAGLARTCEVKCKIQ